MDFHDPVKKISVNSTTVIKNDIASGLKNSRSIFLQYTINTVICQASSTVEPVWVHYLRLAKHTTPVPQRHSPLFCYSRGSPDTVTSLRDFFTLLPIRTNFCKLFPQCFFKSGKSRDEAVTHQKNHFIDIIFIVDMH